MNFSDEFRKRETEFTLGPIALAGLGGGLLLLCILCFTFGYMAGHRGATAVATVPQPTHTVAALPTPVATQKPTAAVKHITPHVVAAPAPVAEDAAAPEEPKPTPASDPDGDIVHPALPASDAPQPATTQPNR